MAMRPLGFSEFWKALALDGDGDAASPIDHAAQVRQVSAAWPFALLVQLAAAITLLTAAVLAERVDTLFAMMLPAGVAATIGLAVLIIFRIPPMKRWPAPVHIRLAAWYSAALGVCFTLLLWQATSLPLDRVQLAAFIAVLGALGVTAITLYAVRVATIGFAAGVAITVSALAGIGPASEIALGCLLCLIIATFRLALLDSATARQLHGENGSGRLAARLVHEFETQGTGWFWQTDRQGVLTYLSDKVASAVVEPGQTAIGQTLSTLFQMDSASPGTERTLGFHMSSRTSFSDYSVRATIDRLGDRWWSISGRPIVDDFGRFQGFIGSGSDLTEQRRAEAEITKLALFDGLTGLANRQRMRASLDKTLNQPGGGNYRPTALFLLDLDRFKVVNDTLGHQVGDALLKQVGQRLLRSIGEAGLVGRLGGDEFMVVFPSEGNGEQLAELARTVIASLSQPYFIEGASISIGCSIGVAIAPVDGDDAETLIRNADLALYAAKADGRGIHRFYREELLHGAQNRKQLEDDLRHALVQDQFHLVYQPVVSTESTRIVGYEALLRWSHPTRGAISPAEFIPVAEDCGLIESIGEWVLRTACLEAAKWPPFVRVGVNVSPIQFANPALPAIVTNAIARSGIAASRLELEITEGVFLDETASSEQMFKRLKAIGVRLALDDFGTGYSSLGYLKNAPFDKIKIDQSFVRGAAIPGNRNAAIIKAIVTLANTLYMETTAEGVEAQNEIDLIRELGCSHIQGFVYGRPARAEDVIAMLAEGKGYASVSGYRVSRSERSSMLRSAALEIGDARGEVRLRNISSTGAMIDGIEFAEDPGNVDLLIELVEGQMFPARLKWAKDGKAGIEFAERFNMERLNGAADTRSLRKVG